MGVRLVVSTVWVPTVERSGSRVLIHGSRRWATTAR